jgi:hypothetical protein
MEDDMSGRIAGKDLLLVGSIPFDTSEEVFHAVSASGIAEALPCVPDGEVGERLAWIIKLSYRLYHGHPDIETVHRPAPVNGVASWFPPTARDNWSFRLRPGVRELHFGDLGWCLGYARDAINSYFVFRTLREKGLLPKDIRFQVSLPLTFSGMGAMFHDPGDWAVMAPAYEEAMRSEIATIVEKIPPGDLAIQWDMAVELGMLEAAVWQTNPYWKESGTSFMDLISGTVERMARAIPAEAMLGYHLCYGTLGAWPMGHGKDLSVQVKCVEMMVRLSGRAVDFVHLPIIDRAPEDYYAPLADLRAGDTKIYLGVVHNVADREDYRRKLALAGRYLSDFGVSAPCGLGREAMGQVPQLLGDHATALALLKDWRQSERD